MRFELVRAAFVLAFALLESDGRILGADTGYFRFKSIKLLIDPLKN